MGPELIKYFKSTVFIMVSVTLLRAFNAEADEGRALFLKNCAACHTLAFEEPRRQGPPLAKIIGRKAGSIENFPYSDGLKAAQWVWSVDNLGSWLENPQSVVPDSYMLYRQKDPNIREKIINFLSFSTDSEKGA